MRNKSINLSKQVVAVADTEPAKIQEDGPKTAFFKS
jgi:hypothetical protein